MPLWLPTLPKYSMLIEKSVSASKTAGVPINHDQGRVKLIRQQKACVAERGGGEVQQSELGKYKKNLFSIRYFGNLA